jgi:TonB family protein
MTDLKRALIVSLAFHLLLVVIGFFIYHEIIPIQLLRQVEILEFRMEQPPTSRVSEYRPVRRIDEPGIREQSEGQASNLAPQRVDLPPAMTQFDDPQERVNTPRHPDLATTPLKLDERIGNTTSRVEGSIAQDARDLAASQIQEQPMTVTSEDYLQHLASLIGSETDSPSAYYLEGEILQRTIVNEVVPEYPPNLQKNATVTISFGVYPDGRVSDFIITKKDDPILEELSLNSLREWRFNPIPQDIVQRGSITFVYQLE